MPRILGGKTAQKTQECFVDSSEHARTFPWKSQSDDTNGARKKSTSSTSSAAPNSLDKVQHALAVHLEPSDTNESRPVTNT